ncbi:hypothetical protein GYMLUDRAFT_245936 [Collybiopsis luxurians FD-317 M1]|uniref:Uncharacterized protein n=1 Tax=Collybiopsis luxurians FD-317 M1 TaxID=944289 RepID=A0A0D0B5B9_9AGAR|nr:hypothetical protein GYMLUDRAFT_245936 [Collybiopsis luxurians FD-317 M1]
MLQAWYGQINEHERNLATAANEGQQQQEFAGENGHRGGRVPGITGRISIQSLLDGPKPTHQSQPPRMPLNIPIGDAHSRGGNGHEQATSPPAHAPGLRAERSPTLLYCRRCRTDEESGSDADSADGGRQQAKKPKQDESLFAWAAEALIQDSILSPRHRKVLELTDNYSADINASIKSLKDEFIDLGEVLAQVTLLHSIPAIQNVPNSLAEAFEFTTIAKPAPTKAITDQVTWRQAWQSAACTIVFAFPF